jgi:cytoskeleton protein RodZ
VAAGVVLIVAVIVIAATGGGSKKPLAGNLDHEKHSHVAATTLPPTTVARLLPAVSSATAATYLVTTTSYSLEISASGACWVNATGPTGTVLYSGTLTDGQSYSIPSTGKVSVILGAASDVDVTLDGKPVVLPVDFHSPFTASFEPI